MTCSGWWASFEKTLLRYYQTTEDRDSVGYRVIDRVFGPRAEDRDHVIGLYEANVAAVLAERLPPITTIAPTAGSAASARAASWFSLVA